MGAQTGGVLLVLWAVGVLRPAGVARGDGTDCPVLPARAAPQPELLSPYRLLLTHQALDVRLGYVPGVVYQGWVMRSSGNGSTARMYVLRAVTADDGYNAAVNLSLPGPGYVRCSTPGHTPPGRPHPSGKPDAIVGAATPGVPVVTNWTAPQLPAPGCIDFIAYILESSGNWFSTSNRICRRKGCFRYVTSPSGVLSSGGGQRYNNNVECVTLLRVPSHMVLHLQFTRFDLEPFRDDTDGCFDYVSVDRTEEDADNTSRQVCGQFSDVHLTNLSFVSDGSYVVVKFVSDSKISRSGFSAIFYSLPVSGCDMFFNASTGHLESLGSGGEYFPNLNCTYTIKAPSSHRIRLTFTQFNLQVEGGADVCSDYVAIETSLEEGVGRRRELFCGNSHPHTVTSSLNWLRLTFNSDFRLQGAGFRAEYATYESCNNGTYVAENGTLTSMGYPQPYLNNQLCHVTLTAPRDGDVIELQFDLLQTQANTTSYLQDAHCDADYVEVYDGVAAHRYCGDWRRKLELLHFRSRGSTMVIKFATDASGTGLGYVARWLVVGNDTALAECSPGWTPHGRACYRVETGPRSWRDAREDCELLGAQLASVRSAQVEDFLQHLIEHSLNGSEDAVVWIGANDQEYEADFYWPDGSRVLYTDWFPGWPQYGAYNSQPSDDGLGDQDCVELRASFPFPSKGMGHTPTLFWNDRACHATNSYVCERVKPGGLVPLPRAPLPGCAASLSVDDHHATGLYTSPGFPSFYDDHSDCSATITAPTGYVIELEFLYFHLEESDRCAYDALTISSTGHHHANSTVVRCGNWNSHLRHLRYVSLSHTLHLRFVSDHSHAYPGFKVRYSLANASLLCPGAQWRHQAGRCYLLHTPPYDWMRAQQTCRMYGAQGVLGNDDTNSDIIKAHVQQTGGNTFWVDAIWNTSISHWTRADGHDIDNDLVGSLTSVIAGSDVRPCLALVVSYDVMHYVIVDCNTSHPVICWQEVTEEHPWLELHVSPNVTLTSPGYPGLPYPTNIRVRWHVTAPEGELLVLSVSFMDLEYHPQCVYDYLLIADPVTGVQARFCGRRTGLSHSVSSNLATVELVSDYRATGRGFSATWRTFPVSSSQNRSITVGDNDTVASGLLQSINYPISHLNDLSYWVTIQGGEGRLWLEVLDLGLGSSSLCGDRLTVYTDRGHLEQHVLCGAPSPEQLINYKYMSRGGYAAVHFTTDGDDNGRGYQLRYQRVPQEQFSCLVTFPVAYNVSGELLSPNSPYSYPAHLDYSLTLQAPLGHLIQLTVSHLELLPNPLTCIQGDHLDVTDPYGQQGELLLQRMCGSKTSGGVTLTSYLHFLQVRLVSGLWDGDRTRGDGYILSYTIIQDPDFMNKSLTDMVVPLGSCDPSPCQNGGECETSDGVSVCQCVGPYTGLVCSWTYCDRGPCQNAGTCVNGNGSYTCSCRLGYGGATCGVDLNQCRRTRCSKNGVCIVRDTGDIDCVCEYNYMGSMCELLRGPKMKSGTRLVEEPFWIGIIIVIGALTLTGFLLLLRRKCLKHIEVECCCCTQPAELDASKSDKISLSNDTGSNYMYNGYHDYMSDPYSRTPQLSAEPSQSSTPIRHPPEVPTIRVYSDDDLDLGPVFTVGGRSHSLDAAAAVFVPHTADIINATSTYSGYLNHALSAIDEEDASPKHYGGQETLAAHTSEDDADSIVSSEAGRVAFIHRDAEGKALETSGETTIRRSQSCSRAARSETVSRYSPPWQSENGMTRASSLRQLSVDDGFLKEATTNFHCWSSVDDDKHQIVKEGMLYEPEDDGGSIRRKSIRTAVEMSSAETEPQNVESQIGSRHGNSAKRREQFVSAVRQARNQHSAGTRPSSHSGQPGQCPEGHSSCSYCTMTSYESAPRLNTSNPHDNFSTHFSQSVDISDSEGAQCRCRRCMHNSDETIAPSYGRHHRSRHHESNPRHRHRKTPRNSGSPNEIRSSHHLHHHDSERRAYHRSRHRAHSWSMSLDIPDDDELDRDALSRHPSSRSAHSAPMGRQSRRDRRDTGDGHRIHSEPRRHRHRSSRSSPSPRRPRHHRSSHSLMEPYSDGDRQTRSHRMSSSFPDSHHRSRSTHSLNNYHHSEREQESHSPYRHKVRDRQHHHQSSKPREHRKLTGTLSDPASTQKQRVPQRLKSTNSLRGKDSSKSNSTESMGRRSECSNRGRNSFGSEQEGNASENESRNGHSPYGRRGTKTGYQGSVNYPGLSTSLEFDSAKGTSLMNSIDYLKVPSIESMMPSDLDTSYGGTSPEALSSTSGVSSTDLRHQSSDEPEMSYSRGSSSLPIQLSGTTPAGTKLSLDIDTPTKDNMSEPHLSAGRQHRLPNIHMGDDGLYLGSHEQLHGPQGDHHMADVFYASPSKHPLQDSAYQSKDQSTEKNASKPGSNVVSPTLHNGMTFSEVYLHTNTNFSSNGNDDKRITNQLELAARKLASFRVSEYSSSLENTQEPDDSFMVDDTTFSRPSSDGTKFMKGRKMWPSRILSIIMDEGESDLSDQCPDMQQWSTNQEQPSFGEHYPNSSGSNSPRIPRGLLTPDFQRKSPRSASGARNTFPAQVSMSPNAARRGDGQSLLERRKRKGTYSPQMVRLDILRHPLRSNSDNSNSSAGSFSNTPETVIEADHSQSDDDAQQSVQISDSVRQLTCEALSDVESNVSHTTDLTDSGHEIHHDDMYHTEHNANYHAQHGDTQKNHIVMQTMPSSSNSLEPQEPNHHNIMYLNHMGNLRIDVISEV